MRLEDVLHRPDWQADAACRDLPTSIFFPTRGESADTARRVCAACPVREECREYGAHEGWGYWGGASPRSRRGKSGRAS